MSSFQLMFQTTQKVKTMHYLRGITHTPPSRFLDNLSIGSKKENITQAHLNKLPEDIMHKTGWLTII